MEKKTTKGTTHSRSRKWIPKNITEAVLWGFTEDGIETDYVGRLDATRVEGSKEFSCERRGQTIEIPYVAQFKWGKPRPISRAA